MEIKLPADFVSKTPRTVGMIIRAASPKAAETPTKIFFCVDHLLVDSNLFGLSLVPTRRQKPRGTETRVTSAGLLMGLVECSTPGMGLPF